MSGPSSLPLLLDVQRTDTDLWLKVRMASGAVEHHAFGLSSRSAHAYQVFRTDHSLSIGGGGIELVFLACRNQQGHILNYGVQTDKLEHFLPLLRPAPFYTFKAVRYGRDSVSFDFEHWPGQAGSFTFGLLPGKHEYTLFELESTWSDDDVGFAYRRYHVRDRAGQKYAFKLYVPAHLLNDFEADEYAYFEAFKAQRSPKFEAAIFSHSYLQAA